MGDRRLQSFSKFLRSHHMNRNLKQLSLLRTAAVKGVDVGGMWSCRQARWIHADEEVSGGVHEVQVNRMVDPAGRAGQHKAKVEVEFVLNKIEVTYVLVHFHHWDNVYEFIIHCFIQYDNIKSVGAIN